MIVVGGAGGWVGRGERGGLRANTGGDESRVMHEVSLGTAWPWGAVLSWGVESWGWNLGGGILGGGLWWREYAACGLWMRVG